MTNKMFTAQKPRYVEVTGGIRYLLIEPNDRVNIMLALKFELRCTSILKPFGKEKKELTGL